MRAIPNLITVFRILCSPAVAWLLFSSRFRLALALIFLAGISDWFDGWSARRLQVDGRLGVILDPLADKVLLVTLFIVLGIIRLIPWWLLALVVGRDLIIVVGALLVRTLRGVKTFRPSTVGKVSTFFQIVLVLLTVLLAAFPHPVIYWVNFTALLLCTLFTALSGADYIRTGIQMARRRHPLTLPRAPQSQRL